MVTFSTNIDVYKVMPKVVKLNLNPARHVEQEWLGEAFLKIVEGKSNKDTIGLSTYAAKSDKFANLARLQKDEVFLLSQAEQENGYKGIDVMMLSVNADGESYKSVEDLLDLEDTIDNFLDMREYVYLEEGKDIWRLLELSRQGNKKAQRKLREVLNNKEHYGNLDELIKYIVLTPICFVKIASILD